MIFRAPAQLRILKTFENVSEVSKTVTYIEDIAHCFLSITDQIFSLLKKYRKFR